MEQGHNEGNQPMATPSGGRARRVILIIAGAILFLLILWAGRQVYLKLRYPEADLIHAIPGSTILLAEGDGLLGFMEQLSAGPLWVSGFVAEGTMDHFMVVAEELKGLQKGGSGLFSDIVKVQPFAMALVPRKKGGPAWLFAVQTGRGVRPEPVHNALRQAWPAYNEKKLLEITYHERVLPDGSPLYITIREGIMIASTDREVFELAYYTIGSGNHLAKDPEFSGVREKISKSQNPATRVFISYDGFYTWMARFIREEKKPLLASLPEMGTWAALELTFTESGAHLQGFTGLLSGRTGLAETMQPSGRILKDPGEVLPANTIFYNQMAINSFKEFEIDYIRNFLEKRNSRKVSYPVEDSVVNALREILSGGSVHSMSVVATTGTDTVAGSNYLIAFHSERSAELAAALNSLCDTTATLMYQGYALQTMKYPYLIPALFGNTFHHFEETFLTVSGEWLIMAPNSKGMLSVINALTLNRLLGNSAAYQEAGKNVQGALQRRYYLDKQQGDEFFSEMMHPDHLGAFHKLLPYLPGLMVMGFTKEPDALLTDIVLYSHGSSTATGKGGEVLLDAIPAAEPVVIRDHRNSMFKLLVADHAGYLYLINNHGEIEWKVNTPEVIRSEIKVIDLYKNGRQQCLFFSQNMIHLIQIDGKYVQGYPVRLSAPFMSHLSVFDYESNGNYRLVYQTSPGRISNVDLTGQPVAGWSPTLSLTLQRPVQFMKLGGQDHLVACDTAGVVHFLDRRGKERFATPASIRIGEYSEIILSGHGAGSNATFTDRTGQLVMVSSEGKTEIHEVLRFSPESRMLRTGSRQSASTEFLIIEPQAVSLFDQSLKLIRRWESDDWAFENAFAVNGDPSVILAATDRSGLPFMLLRNGKEKIKLSGKSFDTMHIWRDKQGDPGYLALTKGTLVTVRPI